MKIRKSRKNGGQQKDKLFKVKGGRYIYKKREILKINKSKIEWWEMLGNKKEKNNGRKN